jgi:hypothetical protein
VLEGMEEVVLANPLRTRLIADAQIKTDKGDAPVLATLLRAVITNVRRFLKRRCFSAQRDLRICEEAGESARAFPAFE